MKGRATDPEAHRLYLQARYFLNRGTRDDTSTGIGYLEQALARDPAFALAWAELCRAHLSAAGNGWTPLAQGYARAREALARALALEPELAEAHARLGWIQMDYDRDWRGAEASFAQALALAPGNAVVLSNCGVLAVNLGRFDEAIDLYRRAIDQDPLSAIAYHNLGTALDAAGNLAAAEPAYRKALELAPQRAVTRALVALNLLAQGRGEEALAEATRESDAFWRIWALAIVQHATGNLADADTSLRQLIAKHAADSAYQVAQVYAARGETDLAFEWLERAYVERDPGLSDMKVSWSLRSLHGDPRWGAFLEKMGLAD